jgi:hypothetical protein
MRAAERAFYTRMTMLVRLARHHYRDGQKPALYPGVFRPAYQEALARLTAFPDFSEGLRINDLIDLGIIKHADFKKVELVEIEPETPAGYFNYFVERGDVYDNAFKASEEKFAYLGLPKPS